MSRRRSELNSDLRFLRSLLFKAGLRRAEQTVEHKETKETKKTVRVVHAQPYRASGSCQSCFCASRNDHASDVPDFCTARLRAGIPCAAKLCRCAGGFAKVSNSSVLGARTNLAEGRRIPDPGIRGRQQRLALDDQGRFASKKENALVIRAGRGRRSAPGEAHSRLVRRSISRCARANG